MKKLILIATVITMMISCNNTKEKPENNAIDKANMDLSIKPGENFYLYANGGWLKNNPLPKDKSRLGAFDLLNDLSKEQVKAIFEKLSKEKDIKDPIAKKIVDYYNTGMNMAMRNKLGIQPIQKDLDKVNSIKNQKDLNNYIIQSHVNGSSVLFADFGSVDAKNSNMVVMHLYQSGLGLPNRDYYFDKDKTSKEIREKYVEHIAKMFVLANTKEKEAKKYANTIMKMETRLAKASMSMLEMRDPKKTYNKEDLKGIKKLAPNFEWTNLFNALKLGDPGVIIVAQPQFFAEMSRMIKTESINDWKIYLQWNLLNGYASYLSENFINQDFDFYSRTLSGKEENLPLWKRVQGVVSGSMSEAIGEMYVKEYFPPEAKERMLKLVNNLRIALGERIANVTWMSDETKKKAQEKLDAISVKIGYPDKWKDYSGLKTNNTSFVDNIKAARAFAKAYNLNKINKPVDKAEWHMPPQMVNAYYSPNMNEIVFPAAILQPPFFFMDADDAVNYGAIGVVIGHEMTHGFDDKGRLFDKDGNLKDWWNEEDAKRFQERADVLVKQFNEFIVIDSMHANGALCLGENIADLGGLNIAMTAFNKTEQSKSTEKIAGFTPMQRFFLAYSHVWAQNIRDAEIIRLTRNDVHSLGKYRVIGPLRNLEEFITTFDIKPTDYMFLEEKDRAIIW